jgi:hypothetical protein
MLNTFDFIPVGKDNAKNEFMRLIKARKLNYVAQTFKLQAVVIVLKYWAISDTCPWVSSTAEPKRVSSCTRRMMSPSS